MEELTIIQYYIYVIVAIFIYCIVDAVLFKARAERLLITSILILIFSNVFAYFLFI